MSIEKYPPFIPIDVYAENFFRLADGDLIKLWDHQKKILRLMFTPDSNGKLPFRTIVYSAPKKSGKTTIAALVASWFAFIMSELNDMIIVVANDLEQAQGRVFKDVADSIRLEPRLKPKCNIQQRLITTNRGVQIIPIANDYAGAAGARFSLVTFDEPWGIISESGKRIVDELTPLPTRATGGRRNSVRFLTGYAGWKEESIIWEQIYKTGKAGECIDEEYGIYINKEASTIMYWDEKGRLPEQTEEYYKEQLMQPGMTVNAFQRLHRNRWVDNDEGIEMNDWNACVAAGIKQGWTKELANSPNKNLYLAAAVDASLKKDRASVTTCFKKSIIIPNEHGDPLRITKTWLGPRQWWQPSKENILDLEETIEKYLLWLSKNFRLGPVYYDPWQFVRSAQTLYKKGLRMIEYSQTIPHGAEMGKHLLDLLKFRNLILYYDEELTREAGTVGVKEVAGRGYRFIKDTPNKKIDSIIALAMAALAAESSSFPDSDQSFRSSVLILRN